MFKQGSSLNNQQGFICHKIQQTNQPTIYIYTKVIQKIRFILKYKNFVNKLFLLVFILNTVSTVFKEFSSFLNIFFG